MTRTDIHSPASPDFDPALYNLIDVFDLHYRDGDQKQLSKAVDKLAEFGITQAPHSNGCGHCGQTGLRYVALLVRDYEWIFVGQDCLSHRFTDMTKDRFTELRKAAALVAGQHKVLAAWNAFCDENPDMAYASYIDNIKAGLGGHEVIEAAGLGWSFGVIADIVRKSRNYGEASVKQVAFVGKLLTEIPAKFAAYEAKLAELAANPLGPVPTGRVALTGTVLTVKFQDSQYGGAWKMLVLLANGAKVWGSVPAAISDDVAKGDQVSFTGTVTAKDGEESFGFFARPASAKIVKTLVAV